MKKLLLLLLLIPNLVLAENVLYCKDEIATGFIKENGSWRTGNFQLLRHTIKFNDDYSALDMGGNPQFSKMTCKRPYGDVKPGHIFCSFEECFTKCFTCGLAFSSPNGSPGIKKPRWQGDTNGVVRGGR